ncbi:MAG: DUF1573 domain-containing protein [Chloroflexota bacterium]
MSKYHSVQKPTRKNNTPQILWGLGIALIVVSLGYIYWSEQKNAQAAKTYQAGDVATIQPILAIHGMGEGPAIPFLPKGEPQPRIVIPETSYDFGTIGTKDVVEQTFMIRNTGEAPLTISRAYTTCGCTTAEISASVIPPGSVATVKLIFDAGFHDATGQTVRRGLIIENNDRERSQAEIWIQATVASS